MTRFVPPAELHSHKLPTDDDFRIVTDMIRDEIRDTHGVILATFFGSAVNNAHNACSDIDVFVLVDDKRMNDAEQAFMRMFLRCSNDWRVSRMPPINLVLERLSALDIGDHSLGGTLIDELRRAMMNGGLIAQGSGIDISEVKSPVVDRWSGRSYVTRKLNKLNTARALWRCSCEATIFDARGDALSCAVAAARKILAEQNVHVTGESKSGISRRFEQLAASTGDSRLTRAAELLTDITKDTAGYVAFVEEVRAGTTPGGDSARHQEFTRLIDDCTLPKTISFLEEARAYLYRR